MVSLHCSKSRLLAAYLVNIGAKTFFKVIQRPPRAALYSISSEATPKIAAVCVKNKWHEISKNETRFTFMEWFQNFSTNRASRDNIHETFGGLLTLYLNSHSVTDRHEFIVEQFNFVYCTLISLQCKDCNFCSRSTDVFLNATLVKTFWSKCVEV